MLPSVDVKATGKHIDNLRIERGMTIKDIQRYFGFSTSQAIYKWIHGKSLPTIDNLVILADLFTCRIDDIIIIKGGDNS